MTPADICECGHEREDHAEADPDWGFECLIVGCPCAEFEEPLP